MAYLGDPRANSINGGYTWESGNRTEERYLWNGQYYDFCDMTPEEIQNVTFPSTGSAEETGIYYTINFKNGEELLLSMSVARNTLPTYTGATPTETEDVGYTYSFNGWTPNIVKATKDATYVAKFTRTAKNYTLSVNGVEKPIAFGTVVVLANLIDRNQDVNPNHYTIKWTDGEGNELNVTSMTMNEHGIVLNYVAEPVPYTIEFKNEDGTVLTAITTGYNETIADTLIPEVPEKVGYTANGWAGVPATMPENGKVILPQYTINQYTVTFDASQGDYTFTASSEADYNSEIVFPTPDAREGYDFDGWDTTATTVPAEDLAISGKGWTIKRYTITFDPANGEEPTGQTVEHFAMPTLPEVNPIKEATPQYRYDFLGWVPAVVSASCDYTYSALYDEILRYYNVTFKWEGGEKAVSTAYGSTAVIPQYVEEYQAIENGIQYDYTFNKWDNSYESITGEVICTAEYTQGDAVKYNIHVTDDASNTYDIPVANGSVVTLADLNAQMPELNPNQYTYKWKKDGLAISGVTMPIADVELTVEKKAVQHTITFVITPNDANVTVPTKITAGYGEAITMPTLSDVEGYTLTGWDKTFDTMPETNETVTAKYEVNSYDIIYTVDGEEIERKSYAYNTDLSEVSIKENPTKDGYSFSGWDNTIPATMPANNVVIAGTFSIESYTLTFKNDEGGVITSSTVEYGSAIEMNDFSKEGYDIAWVADCSEEHTTMPSHDVTYNAVATKKKVTVTFNIDPDYNDNTFESLEVEWGEPVNVFEYLSNKGLLIPLEGDVITINGTDYKADWVSNADDDLETISGTTGWFTPQWGVDNEVSLVLTEIIADTNVYASSQIVNGTFDEAKLEVQFDANSDEVTYPVSVQYVIPKDDTLTSLLNTVAYHEEQIQNYMDENYIDDFDYAAEGYDDYQAYRASKDDLDYYYWSHQYTFILRVPVSKYNEATFSIADDVLQSVETSDWTKTENGDFIDFTKSKDIYVPSNIRDKELGFLITL